VRAACSTRLRRENGGAPSEELVREAGWAMLPLRKRVSLHLI
jgi:hypothetical protein